MESICETNTIEFAASPEAAMRVKLQITESGPQYQVCGVGWSSMDEKKLDELVDLIERAKARAAELCEN